MRLYCSNCKKKQKHRLGNTGELICCKCGCWRNLKESKKK